MNNFWKHAKNVSVLSAGIFFAGLLSGCIINLPRNDTATKSPVENSVATTQDVGTAVISPPVDCSKSSLERSIEKVPDSNISKGVGVSGFFKSLFTETAAMAIDFVSPVPIPVASLARDGHGIYTTGVVAERAYSDTDCK